MAMQYTMSLPLLLLALVAVGLAGALGYQVGCGKRRK